MKQNFLRTKKEIIDWLNKYGVKNYKLIPDDEHLFIVDVNSDVDLSFKKLKNKS